MRRIILPNANTQPPKATKGSVKKVVVSDKEYYSVDEFLDRVIPRVEALFDKK